MPEELLSKHPVKYDTYQGLVMAGYQGWFNTPGDGAGRGWYHYQGKQGQFMPGNCSIDMWPDVSEYEKSYETSFSYADGTRAKVFSSYDSTTVYTHFRWMKQYGIDGVFMQRFVGEIKGESGRKHFDRVFQSAVTASTEYGRAIAIMYDLSGIQPGDEQILLSDIDRLSAIYDFKKKENCPGYLYHRGKPLVAVWGVGFNDGRKYGLKEATLIVNGLKERGFSVLLGVPAYWRSLDHDTVHDIQLHELIKQCDVILPWFVGRYGDYEGIDRFGVRVKEDLAWCETHEIDYVPLVFPGFSWKNMFGKDATTIERDGGRFLWRQVVDYIGRGAQMLYIAMFDEIDEGTAVFKCATRVPVGESEFLPIESDLSSDYYLWLSGMAGKLLRKEIPLEVSLPKRQ